MDAANVYIVEGSAGQWDSHRTWLVAAFTVRSAAEDWRAQAQLHSDRALSIDEASERLEQYTEQYFGGPMPEDRTIATCKQASQQAEHQLGRELNPYDPRMQWHRFGTDDPCPQYRVVELPVDPVTP